jgi:hypothetical protein
VSMKQWPDYEKWAYIEGYIKAVFAMLRWSATLGRSELRAEDVCDILLVRTSSMLHSQGISLTVEEWGRAGGIAGRQWFLMTTDNAALFEAQIAEAL